MYAYMHMHVSLEGSSHIGLAHSLYLQFCTPTTPPLLAPSLAHYAQSISMRLFPIFVLHFVN